MFESIPDGISFKRSNGNGTVDVLVNHELSLVPFPARRRPVAINDFTNASEIRLNQQSGGRPQGEVRDPERGELPALLLELPRRGPSTGSSASSSSRTRRRRDFVSARGRVASARRRASPAPSRPASSSRTTSRAAPTGRSTEWAATTTRTASASRATATRSCSRATTRSTAPVVAALPVQGGERRRGLERPGPPLRVRVGQPGDQRLRRPVGARRRSPATFIQVGRDRDRQDKAARSLAGLRYPRPTDPARAADAAMPTGRSGCSSTGAPNNVFQFIRIEDIAYDRTNGSPNVVYFADTGEPRAIPRRDGRRGCAANASGTRGPYPNGRIFKLVLTRPTRSATASCRS